MKLVFEIPEEYVGVIAAALMKMPIEFAGATWQYMAEEHERARQRAAAAIEQQRAAEIEAQVAARLAAQANAP